MFTQQAFPRCYTIPRITVEGDSNQHTQRAPPPPHALPPLTPTHKEEREEGRQGVRGEVEGDNRSDGGRERCRECEFSRLQLTSTTKTSQGGFDSGISPAVSLLCMNEPVCLLLNAGEWWDSHPLLLRVSFE